MRDSGKGTEGSGRVGALKLLGLGSTCMGGRVVEVDVDGVCAVDMEEVVERLGRREDLDMPPCLGCDTDLHKYF